MFFKVINKKGVLKDSGLYAALQIGELENSWFRFLISRTGYRAKFFQVGKHFVHGPISFPGFLLASRGASWRLPNSYHYLVPRQPPESQGRKKTQLLT